VSRGIKHTTYQKRATMLSRALWHKTCHLSKKGFNVAMCPEAPNLSPGRRKLWNHHMSPGPRPAPAQEGSNVATCPVSLDLPPDTRGLRSRHVFSGSRPPTYPCILKTLDIRPIMASPGTWAGSALNAYVTGHTQHMVGIKCVQDVDAVGRR
jgi:hypothetical protein